MFIRTSYWWIGVPPSNIGGFHWSSNWLELGAMETTTSRGG
jgi:hypothetical protein